MFSICINGCFTIHLIFTHRYIFEYSKQISNKSYNCWHWKLIELHKILINKNFNKAFMRTLVFDAAFHSSIREHFILSTHKSHDLIARNILNDFTSLPFLFWFKSVIQAIAFHSIQSHMTCCTHTYCLLFGVLYRYFTHILRIVILASEHFNIAPFDISL